MEPAWRAGSAPAPAVRQNPPPCRHAARAWRWPAARRRRTCTSPAVRTTRRTRGGVPTQGAPPAALAPVLRVHASLYCGGGGGVSAAGIAPPELSAPGCAATLSEPRAAI